MLVNLHFIFYNIFFRIQLNLIPKILITKLGSKNAQIFNY